jgi:hypothetical protein
MGSTNLVGVDYYSLWKAYAGCSPEGPVVGGSRAGCDAGDFVGICIFCGTILKHKHKPVGNTSI